MGTKSTTTQQMPEFQQEFLEETVIPYATNIAEREFTPYEGSRVAGMTPLQQQSLAGYGNIDMGGAEYDQALGVYGDLGQFQSPEAQAAQLAQAERMQGVGQVGDVTAGQLASTDIGSYMSPYQQSVIEASLRTLGSAQEQALDKLSAQATAARAFGGSRQGVAEAETRKAYGQQASDLVTQQMQQAFENAQRSAQADISGRMQADTLNQRAAEAAAARDQAARAGNMAAANQFAQQQAQFQQQANLANQQAAIQAANVRATGAAGLGATAGQRLQSELTGLGAQMQAGEAQRALEQAQLDAQFAEFARQQDFPLTGLSALTSAASGIPNNLGTTTQRSGGLGNILGAVGGAGQGLAAMGFTPFSDAALKQDIQRVGQVGDVNLYRWEWNDTAKSIGADRYPSTGVIAQEVETKYPKRVIKDASGFRRVDYAGLYSDLGAL